MAPSKKFPENMSESQQRFLDTFEINTGDIKKMIEISRKANLTKEQRLLVDKTVKESLRIYFQAVRTSMKDFEKEEEQKKQKEKREETVKVSEKENMQTTRTAPPTGADSELQKLISEMCKSAGTHIDVYPPEPLPEQIAIPTGGLAKCQCAPDCTKELQQPAYRILGAEDDARWF